LAAQLVGRIRDEVPEAAGAFFDSMLRELLEGATVAALAAGLASGTAAAQPATAAPPGGASGAPPSLLFPIVADGTGPVQLVLPDGAGDIAAARARIRADAPA